MFRKISDFDGDGKTDYVLIRNENNLMVWYVWQSTGGLKIFQFGLWTDTPAAGDYDGDGKTDFAVRRQAVVSPTIIANIFYIFQSQDNSFTYKVMSGFTNTENPAVQQDYDGDGKTDPAFLFQEPAMSGFVSILRSSNGTSQNFSIPANSSLQRLGDLSGDGRADRIYVAFPGNLVTIFNLETGSTRTVQFGLSGDQYIPADFDGDGIGDLAVWRGAEGNWYWLRSSDNAFQAFRWGTSGDTPVPGDYDNDGKTDFAVWRSGSPNGIYYVRGSLGGVQIFTWGISGDRPVRY